jgi:flagellar biosynthetic protein FliO
VEDVSMVALLARLAISLAVVFGLMVLAGRLLRRRGLSPGSAGKATSRIDVIARQGLSRSSSVQVVRVGGRTLILGVTDAAISVLAESDPLLLEAELALAPAESATPQPPGWRSLVELLKDRTARSS